MITYKIYVRHGKKFRHDFTTQDPKRAELVAVNDAKALCYNAVKVIATDDNGITNEIIYK